MKHEYSLHDSDVSLVWSMVTPTMCEVAVLIINDEGFLTLKTVLLTPGSDSSKIRAARCVGHLRKLAFRFSRASCSSVDHLYLMLMGPNGRAAWTHYERMRTSLHVLTGNWPTPARVSTKQENMPPTFPDDLQCHRLREIASLSFARSLPSSWNW